MGCTQDLNNTRHQLAIDAECLYNRPDIPYTPVGTTKLCRKGQNLA